MGSPGLSSQDWRQWRHKQTIMIILAGAASLSSQSVLANVVRETPAAPANTSDHQRISRAMFEVPRVPNSEHGQDHHNPRFENYDDHGDHFENRYDQTNNEELSPPCSLLVERLKERLLRDQARIEVYGGRLNDFSQSAMMSGFNSFVVEECTAPAQGLLLLRLKFNEITIATRAGERQLGHHDRNHQPDHFQRYHNNRYRNTWADRGDFRDRGISPMDSFQRRNSDREYDDHYDRYYDRDNHRVYDRDYDRNYDRDYDRNHDRDYERDIVQAYGVVLEFGYISKAAAESNYDRPLAGVTINLADVEMRPPGGQIKLGISAFKEDLELQLENIFDDVIRDIKSEARPELYEDRQRYKRDVEFLDAEIAKLQEGLPRRKYNFDRRNTKRKRKCRCKRDSSSDVEGRKGHEFNNKWKKTKTKPNRKSKDPINDKQKKSFDRDQLLLERRMARIKRRKEKRVRKQKWKKGKVWSNCSC